MVAVGARVFAGGLSSPSSAKWVRAEADGKLLVTDGPYSQAKEHIMGLWVLKAANLDEALAWARKAALATNAVVEVRPFEYPKKATEITIRVR